VTDETMLDLSNYKDRLGQRVTPGRYHVMVEDAELQQAHSGNQMINVWLRVVGGEFDSLTIVDRLVLTEKSLFRVVGFMQAIGMPTPKKKFKLNIRAFVGKHLEVDVEDGDPYNGRVKSEVRGYLRLSGPVGAGSEDLDLSGLDEFAPPEEAAAAVNERLASQADTPDLVEGDGEKSSGDIDLDDLRL
jgi:hypothetical protein